MPPSAPRPPPPDRHFPTPCPGLRVARALFRQVGKDQPGFPVPLLPGQNVGKPEARLEVAGVSGQHLPVFLFPSPEIPRKTERPCKPEACLPVPGVLLKDFLKRCHGSVVLARSHLGYPSVQLSPAFGLRQGRGEKGNGEQEGTDGQHPPPPPACFAGCTGASPNPFLANFSHPVLPK